jgi:hypothetical protein
LRLSYRWDIAAFPRLIQVKYVEKAAQSLSPGVQRMAGKWSSFKWRACHGVGFARRHVGSNLRVFALGVIPKSLPRKLFSAFSPKMKLFLKILSKIC